MGGQQSAARRALDLRVQVANLLEAVRQQADVQAQLASSLRDLRGVLQDFVEEAPARSVRPAQDRPER